MQPYPNQKTIPREEYLALKAKNTQIKDYFTDDVRSHGFSIKQYELLSDMAAAEVKKVSLPGQIKAASKKLQGAEAARVHLLRANALDKVDAQLAKKMARDNLVVTAKVPTPKRKRGK